MYRDLFLVEEQGLRAGDVVKLELGDFEKILRHYPSMAALLKQFYSEAKYKSKLWAILNKPCDMVHDGEGRTFDTNLFLAPLQGFLSELRPGGVFKKYVKTPVSIQAYPAVLTKFLEDDLNIRLNQKFKIQASMGDKQKAEIIEEKEQFKKEVSETFDTSFFSMFSESDDPAEIENAMLKFSQRGNLHSFITPFFEGLATNKSWVKYKNDRAAALKALSQVEISKEGVNQIPELFLNQMDTRGIFYFEPDKNLFSPELEDFSFFIEMEDMITFKVNEECIRTGALVDLLKAKRLTGLNRNFSDRLQNVMGNYFSKIGTADVKATKVLRLYSDVFEKFNYFGNIS